MTATIDIPADLEDVAIPSLIVQPLVENAIKHGIALARRGGSLSVTARVDASGPTPELCVVVRNTGARFAGRESGEGAGVGLRSVERRLQCYYGDAASLSLRHNDDGSTTAELRLPVGDIDDANVAAIAGVARP